MEELLSQIIWDNTVQRYLIVAGVILLGFLLKKYLAHSTVEFFFLLLTKRYKQVDIVSFKKLVARPLGLFIAVLIMVVTLDQLNFPRALDFSIYHLKLKELFRMIATAALIFTFFRFLIRCIDFAVLLIRERYIQDDQMGSHQLVFFFKDFIKVLIGIIGTLLLLKYVFRYDIKGLLTGLSIVGAAVALALKESLENLIASFIIFFDKPFATGDYVRGSDFAGNIEKIGLRSTRLRTDAKTYLTVPNKKMVDSVVDNQSNLTQRRTDLKLELEADTKSDQIRELLDRIRTILEDRQVQNTTLFLNDIRPGALQVTVIYFTGPIPYTDYTKLRQTINLEILEYLESAGINLTGTMTNISLVNPQTVKDVPPRPASPAPDQSGQ